MSHNVGQSQQYSVEKVTTQLEVFLRVYILCVYAVTIPHD